MKAKLVNTISVAIETKSSAGQNAIFSILDDDVLNQQLMDRVAATVKQFIDEAGVMGSKPFEVTAGSSEHGLTKLLRGRLKDAKEASRAAIADRSA
jgi:hypothetical protein